MSALKFADSHNMVAFLAKPTESDGFEQILDFLNVNPIKYALTVNPTIYTSCIEQFWATAKVKTINGEVQLQALVDGKKNVDSSVKFLMYPRSAMPTDPHHTPIIQPLTSQSQKKQSRRKQRKDTEIPQSSGPTKPIADEAANEENVPTQSNNPPLSRDKTRLGYVFNGEEVFVAEQSEKVVEEVVSTAEVSVAAIITTEEITLAQALAELRSVKPKSSEPTNLVADKVVHEERGDSMEKAATTATSLDAKQDNVVDPSAKKPWGIDLIKLCLSLSKQSYDSPLRGVNTPQSDEDKIELKELMEICTKLSERVIDLETTKTAQANEIANLKKRVKKLERKRNDFDEEFDANMDEAIEQVYDANKDTVEEGEVQVPTADMEVNTASVPFTTVGVSVSTAEPITIASEVVTTAKPSTPPTTTTITTVIEDEDLIIAQTLMKMKSEKSKVRGVTMQEPNETATRPTIPPLQHDPKDKGKAKMVEPKKPLKRKAQIKFDEEVAQRLQAQMQAELEEEGRLEKQR
ncbi:hypothetical protein Tco_0146282 [Tanacetum coccineum]